MPRYDVCYDGPAIFERASLPPTLKPSVVEVHYLEFDSVSGNAAFFPYLTDRDYGDK